MTDYTQYLGHNGRVLLRKGRLLTKNPIIESVPFFRIKYNRYSSYSPLFTGGTVTYRTDLGPDVADVYPEDGEVFTEIVSDRTANPLIEILDTPLLNTESVTRIKFDNVTSLTHIPSWSLPNLEDIELYRATNLTALPDFKIGGKLLEIHLTSCPSLTEIPAYPLSEDSVVYLYMCDNVARIHLTGIGKVAHISSCMAMDHDALMEVIGNLRDRKGKTAGELYMSNAQFSKLSADDRKQYTSKNWVYYYG